MRPSGVRSFAASSALGWLRNEPLEVAWSLPVPETPDGFRWTRRIAENSGSRLQVRSAVQGGGTGVTTRQRWTHSQRADGSGRVRTGEAGAGPYGRMSLSKRRALPPRMAALAVSL